jgi:hypothetical protein
MQKLLQIFQIALLLEAATVPGLAYRTGGSSPFLAWMRVLIVQPPAAQSAPASNNPRELPQAVRSQEAT